MKAYLCLLFCLLLGQNTKVGAQQNKENQIWSFHSQIAYTLGAASPQGFPSEIRAIKSFSPLCGLSFGTDVRYAYTPQWGFSGGLHLSFRGMRTQARVKSYYTQLLRGGEQIEGYFTGENESQLQTTTLSIPLRCTWQCSPRWLIAAGPFVDIHLQKSFSGSVYNGYIRRGSPTGEKVNFDSKDNPSTPTYDFSAHLRTLTWGVSVLVDYKVYQRWAAFATVDYGLNGIFQSDFHTLSFPLHNLYARLGISYRW